MSAEVKPFTNPSLIFQGGHLLTFFSYLTKLTLLSAICSPFSLIQYKPPQISILKAQSLNLGFCSLMGTNNKLHCHLLKINFNKIKNPDLVNGTNRSDQH